jgi:hypothetical protein
MVLLVALRLAIGLVIPPGEPFSLSSQLGSAP